MKSQNKLSIKPNKVTISDGTINQNPKSKESMVFKELELVLKSKNFL